jgi:hypothetical protein
MRTDDGWRSEVKSADPWPRRGIVRFDADLMGPRMLDTANDIRSLSEFKRNTTDLGSSPENRPSTRALDQRQGRAGAGRSGISGTARPSGSCASLSESDGLQRRTGVRSSGRGDRTPARRRAGTSEHHTDAAHAGEEPCGGVLHRLSARRAFACSQPLQVHAGPQPHASPHWQEAAGRSAGFWQPHVHSAPMQVMQAQPFN